MSKCQAELKVTPAAISGDAEFVRRVCLDLTGVIPTAKQTRDFLDDLSPARSLWLVPLTMIPPSFMGGGGASPLFGPDSSIGLLPIPHVLA